MAQAVNTVIRELIVGCKWEDAVDKAKKIPGMFSMNESISFTQLKYIVGLDQKVVSALDGSATTGGGGYVIFSIFL